MIAITHLAVGATAGLWSAKLAGKLVDSESDLVQISVRIGSAFVAGTLSHLILDAMPHNEFIYGTPWKWPLLMTEALVVFNVIFWLWYIRELEGLDLLVIFFGMVGGAWLDCLSMMRGTVFCNNALISWIIGFHNYFHSTVDPGPMPSLPIQIIIAVIALMFLF